MGKFDLKDLKSMEISDEKGNIYPIVEGFPSAKMYANYKIKNAIPFHIPIGKKNMIIFQLIDADRGVVCISDYIFKTKMTLNCRSKEPILEIYSTLEGVIQFHLEHDEFRDATAGTFNAITLPSINNRATLDGHVRTVDYHLDQEYLEELSHTHPALKTILKSFRNKKSAAIFEDYGELSLIAAYQTTELITRVHEDNIDMKKRFEAVDTIIESLLEPEGISFQKSKFTYNQLTAIAYLVRYINENLELRLKISDLIDVAKKFAILNAYIIRKAFKLIKGTTPVTYMKKQRIYKAVKYFEQGLSETSIAARLGYNDLGNFERDFKDVLKISTKEYKQGLKKTK